MNFGIELVISIGVTLTTSGIGVTLFLWRMKEAILAEQMLSDKGLHEKIDQTSSLLSKRIASTETRLNALQFNYGNRFSRLQRENIKERRAINRVYAQIVDIQKFLQSQEMGYQLRMDNYIIDDTIPPHDDDETKI